MTIKESPIKHQKYKKNKKKFKKISNNKIIKKKGIPIQSSPTTCSHFKLLFWMV